MTSSNGKEESNTKPCKCNCCLNPFQNFANSLDHQNSANFQYDFQTSTTSSLYPHTQFTNPESLPTLQDSFRRFTRAFPQFLDTVESDQIRANEYTHLSLSSHVCLDYTGHALCSYAQQQEQHEEKQQKVESLASCSSSPVLGTTHLEFKLRERIMRYLNLCEEDYTMFLTPNQTSAFGILAGSYPFKTNRSLVTVYDHENEAVEAIIGGSRRRGARVMSAEFKWPKLKIHCSKLEEMLLGRNKKSKNRRSNKGLFVFPVQSRVTGARYSYQWMNIAQENGWHVLVDASGIGPKEMDTLGLSLFRPDFLVCTFYKVFGDDPSGFTCLLVKKSVASIVNLSDYSDVSSTPVVMSLVSGTSLGLQFRRTSAYRTEEHNDRKSNGARIEEFDVECRGLDHADSLGLILIGIRTRCLVNWLVNALQALSQPHYEKSVQLVTIYGPRVRFDRGHALAFNVYDWKGEKVDPSLVQKLAGRNNISLGCGCIKHVSFSERYTDDKRRVLDEENRGRECKKENRGKMFGCRISVLTVSVGFLTNFEDVYRLWEFVARFLDADFIEKERWRYTALNQRTIEV